MSINSGAVRQRCGLMLLYADAELNCFSYETHDLHLMKIGKINTFPYYLKYYSGNVYLTNIYGAQLSTIT